MGGQYLDYAGVTDLLMKYGHDPSEPLINVSKVARLVVEQDKRIDSLLERIEELESKVIMLEPIG